MSGGVRCTEAIYLDYNATAPVKPQVSEAIAKALMMAGNPSSVHQFGRDARNAVDRLSTALTAVTSERNRLGAFR